MELDRDQLLSVFRDEAEEGIASLEAALLVFEREPSSGEALATIFRHAHTLKGNAYALGMRPLGDFAHALEDLLDRLRGGHLAIQPSLIALLLRAVDALRVLLPAAISGADLLDPGHEELRLALLACGPETSGPAARLVEAPQPVAQRRSMRVELEKLDRILSLIGSMSVARLRLGQLLERNGTSPDALDLHRELDAMTRDLHDEVLRVRAVPLESAFRPQQRALHDAAATCGRSARLVFEGEEVEADTGVVDGLRAPLAHMVRNAVAHGLESPEERLALGKDACGTVTLRARQEAGCLLVEVCDDGRGFDRRRLLETARARGLSAPESMPDDELHQLAFLPGFSTAEAVNEIAGRGVGLDVVRTAIEAMRGTIALDSRSGVGTRLTLRLPLTLAILDGFVVEVGGESFILPIGEVVECLDLPAGAMGPGASAVVDLRGQPLPCLRLRELFRSGAPPARRDCLVVVQQGQRRVGLAVDALHGVCQVLVKPLARSLRTAPGVSGTAILGTGRVALVLEPQVLLREAAQSLRNDSPGVAA